MAFTHRKISFHNFGLLALSLAVSMLVASCGGGGGSPGANGSGGGINTPTISLTLVSPTSATTNLAAYASTSLTVKVLSNGVVDATPVPVTFASSCATSGKASLPASATTTNGQVTVTYTDKDCAASDAITISTPGASSITETLVVAAPIPASVEFVSAVPAGKTIVIKGAGGNGRVETATLTFEALDISGNPLPNETVNFSINSTQPVTLQSTSGITGANGQVTVAVNSGTLPTTFRVIATLPTGQTTISDTIAVTTGLPVQAGFSLSATSHNIEGWAYDNTQTTLNILLADQSGNPVADGTPVVFETDSGAVGSSTNGGCTTANGACSVTFRSQNPRYGVGNTAGKRAGLATVNVSTTTGSSTLSGQIGVFLSGSFATNIVQSPAGTLALTSCNLASFTLQLNDVNFNPMPSGTTITEAVLGTIPNAVLPAVNPINPTSVQDVGPATLVVSQMAAAQGSFHTFLFTPGTAAAPGVCNNSGAGTGSGTILVSITTPKGNVTTYPVNFTYPM